MGMSIKEAIPILHDMYNYYNDTDIDAYIGFEKDDNNAIETALDTMRKYQKIEQILKDIPYGGEATVRRIQEVVENGNDTTNTGNN